MLYLFIRNFDDFDEIIKLIKIKIEISKLLISAKADLNIQDFEGRSSLHWAVKRENVEAVKLLLAAKVDKNIQDGFGKTALDYANTQKIKEILRRK